MKRRTNAATDNPYLKSIYSNDVGREELLAWSRFVLWSSCVTRPRRWPPHVFVYFFHLFLFLSSLLIFSYIVLLLLFNCHASFSFPAPFSSLSFNFLDLLNHPCFLRRFFLYYLPLLSFSPPPFLLPSRSLIKSCPSLRLKSTPNHRDGELLPLTSSSHAIITSKKRAKERANERASANGRRDVARSQKGVSHSPGEEVPVSEGVAERRASSRCRRRTRLSFAASLLTRHSSLRHRHMCPGSMFSIARWTQPPSPTHPLLYSCSSVQHERIELVLPDTQNAYQKMFSLSRRAGIASTSMQWHLQRRANYHHLPSDFPMYSPSLFSRFSHYPTSSLPILQFLYPACSLLSLPFFSLSHLPLYCSRPSPSSPSSYSSRTQLSSPRKILDTSSRPFPPFPLS